MRKTTVAITGASRGIGFTTARAFLEAGANVSGCSKSQDSLERAQAKLGKIGDYQATSADVADYHQVSDFIEATAQRFGQIDVLINNAGVAWAGDFVDQGPENIDELIDVNIKGVLYTTRAALPRMIHQKSGTIINISSGAGLTGFPTLATYCATKFALVGWTESLAAEVAAVGIKVYAVCPGAVATDMQEEISGWKAGISPEEVTEKILELAGPNPSIESGGCLKVYG